MQRSVAGTQNSREACVATPCWHRRAWDDETWYVSAVPVFWCGAKMEKVMSCGWPMRGRARACQAQSTGVARRRQNTTNVKKGRRVQAHDIDGRKKKGYLLLPF